MVWEANSQNTNFSIYATMAHRFNRTETSSTLKVEWSMREELRSSCYNVLLGWPGKTRETWHLMLCITKKTGERHIRELQKRWEVQQMETVKLQNVKMRGFWGLKKRAGKNTEHSGGAQTSELEASINFKDLDVTLNNMRITFRYYMSSRSVEICPLHIVQAGNMLKDFMVVQLPSPLATGMYFVHIEQIANHNLLFVLP